MISTYRHRDLSHLIIYTLYLETNESHLLCSCLIEKKGYGFNLTTKFYTILRLEMGDM